MKKGSRRRTSKVLVCEDAVLSLQRTESKAEQPVDPHLTEQLPPPRRCALFHHHQPQPDRPRQEEDFPAVVRRRLSSGPCVTDVCLRHPQPQQLPEPGAPLPDPS